MARNRRIEVRATIHLPRLGVGQHAWVDPENPQVAALIAGDKLVPLKPYTPPVFESPEPSPEVA
jgi:hypothetical protein